MAEFPGEKYMYHIDLNPMLSDRDIESLNALHRRLSPQNPAIITRKQIIRFNRGWNSALVVARATEKFPATVCQGRIVGMGILPLEDTLTRITAKIDSLVILEEAEHRGIGGALLDALVAHAWTIPEVERVMLTCRESREEGLRLYRTRKFRLRETNVLYLSREAA